MKYQYILVDEDGDTYGTNDLETADYAGEAGCIGVNAETGVNLFTGKEIPEYPAPTREELEAESEVEDLDE